MMVPTHILAGAALGLLSLSFSTSNANALIWASIAAAFFPDLDVFFKHRKTFHRPFEYVSVFIISVAALSLINSFFIYIVVFVSASLSLHCLMDLFSTKNRDKALYDHFLHEWINVRNYIPTRSYRDAFIAFLFSIPVLIFVEGFYYVPVALLLIYVSSYPMFRERIESKMIGEHSTYTEALHAWIYS